MQDCICVCVCPPAWLAFNAARHHQPMTLHRRVSQSKMGPGGTAPAAAREDIHEKMEGSGCRAEVQLNLQQYSVFLCTREAGKP